MHSNCRSQKPGSARRVRYGKADALTGVASSYPGSVWMYVGDMFSGSDGPTLLARSSTKSLKIYHFRISSECEKARVSDI